VKRREEKTPTYMSYDTREKSYHIYRKKKIYHVYTLYMIKKEDQLYKCMERNLPDHVQRRLNHKHVVSVINSKKSFQLMLKTVS
jgi:hypothetical protein